MTLNLLRYVYYVARLHYVVYWSRIKDSNTRLKVGLYTRSNLLGFITLRFYASTLLRFMESKIHTPTAQSARQLVFTEYTRSATIATGKLFESSIHLAVHFLRFIESKIHTPTCASRRQVVEDSFTTEGRSVGHGLL